MDTVGPNSHWSLEARSSLSPWLSWGALARKRRCRTFARFLSFFVCSPLVTQPCCDESRPQEPSRHLLLIFGVANAFSGSFQRCLRLSPSLSLLLHVLPNRCAHLCLHYVFLIALALFSAASKLLRIDVLSGKSRLWSLATLEPDLSCL